MTSILRVDKRKRNACSSRYSQRVERGKLDTTGKLVSIIVPIYNVEKYLGRCLSSLMHQSYKTIEVLLVDDGSTDGSASVAKDYIDKDSRFKLIQKQNGGQGSARNVGLDNARGDYICFVDSDDWVNEDYVLKLISCSVANDADIVMCGVERVWEDGTRIRNPISNNKEYIIPDVHQFLFHASYVSWDKIFRRELFDNLRYSEIRTFEDYATIPLVLSRAKKIIGLPDVLYYYFWRFNSTTNTSRADYNILRAQEILEKSELKKYPDVLASYFVRNVIGSLIWNLAASYKNKSKVLTIIGKAKKEYVDLERYITSDNIGSIQFGRLIYNEKYLSAYLYRNTIETSKKYLRPVYHKIQKKRQKE